MIKFYPNPAVLPPGPWPWCSCLNFGGSEHPCVPLLHAERQDRSCEAWRIVEDNIETTLHRGDEVLEPLAGLDAEQRQQIITLPASIGALKQVRSLRLYGSHLVRLPPEVGAMTALEDLDVYTSYRLHFLPYELLHCRALKRSRVSTRAIYGNHKYRPPFPALEAPANRDALAQLTPAVCSVCRLPLGAPASIQRWIMLRVGTDWVPLLLTACSHQCVTLLPTPAKGYVQEAHTGGLDIVQPPTLQETVLMRRQRR